MYFKVSEYDFWISSGFQNVKQKNVSTSFWGTVYGLCIKKKKKKYTKIQKGINKTQN